jgi:photosystem II stability/assembly factor-like uncharacterized protein
MSSPLLRTVWFGRQSLVSVVAFVTAITLFACTQGRERETDESSRAREAEQSAEREEFARRSAAFNRLAGTQNQLILYQRLKVARAQRTRAIERARAAYFGTSWASVGPNNVPGRITSLAIPASTPETIYAGSAAGGVFKSVDAGAHWIALWQDQESLAIGAIAVSESTNDTIYAATGEWVGGVGASNTSFPGVGVFHSHDAGKSWLKAAPISSLLTTAMAVDPKDPLRIYVAGDTALHRSRDGGAHWDTAGGAINGIFDGVVTDVVVDPMDPLRLYIGVDNRGVWRSSDGGDSWLPLREGIVAGADAPAPKIALGRRGAHGTKFVAVKAGRRVFTSTDGGDHFMERAPCDEEWPSFYAWANVIAVDPGNENILIAGHASLYRSQSGGAAWSKVGGYGMAPVHPDQQAVAFDPRKPGRVWAATDGGVFLSDDDGRTWASRSIGLITAQCWTVSVSDVDPLNIAITTQDNAAYRRVSGGSFAILQSAEGGWVSIDPRASSSLYLDTWFSNLRKSINDGMTWSDLGLNTDSEAGNAVNVAISPADSRIVLVIRADGVLIYSDDGGTRWNPVLDTHREILTSVVFAPSAPTVVYAGSAMGRVWSSSDSGRTWRIVTSPGLPGEWIYSVKVSPLRPNIVFVGFAAIGTRQLWRGTVTAGSARWEDIGGLDADTSLPDLAITGMAVHPSNDDRLYVANLLGVYESRDNGKTWLPFGNNLPNTWVSGLTLRARTSTMYVSTMGRGVFEIAVPP